MQYTKFLRWALLGGLCLVPFISLIVATGSIFPNMFFPFITGKNFAFRILVELLLLVYVILAMREPKYRPKASLIMWSVGIFVLWMAVATALSVDPVKSFWSNFERMDGYITVLHLFALFIVAGAVLAAEKWWDVLFRISVATGALQGAYALMQVFHIFGLTPSSQSGPRADTSFGNATYLAVFMLFNIFITLLMLVRDWRSLNARVVYGMALVLEFPALYFTETRGAILGALGGIIIMALWILIRARGTAEVGQRRAAWVTLGVIVLLVGGFFALKDTSFVRGSGALARLASISLQDPTTTSRLNFIWPIAIKGALEKPVTGWGQENFNFIFNKYYNPAMWGQEQWFDRAHNEFLDWLVAGGFPAALLYVSFFALAAWAIVRSDALSPAEQAILLGLLAAYGFNNLFVFDNLMSIVYFFLILAFVHGLSWKPLPRFMALSRPMSEQSIAVVAPLVAVAIVGGMWYFNWDGIARAQTLISAIETTDPATGTARTPDQSLAAFKTALSQGELGLQETTEQLFQYSSNSIAPSTSATPEQKQEFYNLTLSAGNAMLAQRKNDARLELFDGIFLSQFGQYDQALAHLQEAAALSPDKQQILFQEGLMYVQKGDVADALPILKKAYDLAPDYDEARIVYAGGLYYAGQNAAADALLTERFGTTTVDDDQLLQFYQNTKQYGRVIDIWNLRLASDPTNVNDLYSLAAVYFASGDTTHTIAILQQIIKDNPSLASQIQPIITQVQNGTLKPGQ
ncbi:MAG TPA: O-antigen ligase family protein [Candidatus Paceibacterota bacterium]|nr:O-antigen ligase family protein [Candidatus Paceibacterota bacterium]